MKSVSRNSGMVLTVDKSMPVSLVVDDEASVRKYVRAILEGEGFRTLAAEDGAQALRVVQELGSGLDLIVSDIQMPNGDGLSLAHAVENSFPAVPVILVSGDAKPDGGFAFVKKPFLPGALMSVVRKLVPQRASHRSDRLADCSARSTAPAGF